MIIETISAWGGSYVESPTRSARAEWTHQYRKARKHGRSLWLMAHTCRGLERIWATTSGCLAREA